MDQDRMNAVELLMVEHASLRLHFQYARKTANWDSIYEIEDFVRNCHARSEDEVVFPQLQKEFVRSSNQETLKILSRLEADHKLIDTIGDQIKSRTVQGDTETLRKRILLYANTVESHNSSEEALIFQYWKNLDTTIDESAQNSVSLFRQIIQDYGLNRYFQITGISEKLLDSVHK
ncbi:MAG: hemerythrin domain-containing protein [Thaumarchaeota archaeon]|nr:hemerythrin domain-containing protein [Nitrososphaerota archaeon]